MLDDGKLGTVLAAGAAVFAVFFVIFLWLVGWGFYVSSALGAVAAVIVIWWMGVEDAEIIEEAPGHGRVTSRPVTPEAAPAEDTMLGTTTPIEATPLEDHDAAPHVTDDMADDAVTAPVTPPVDVEPLAAAAPQKPALMDAPDGEPDDLTKIKGVGPKLRDMLNGMGVWHFRQIAGWSEAELDWVDENLDGFKGRARRDDWVGQAKALA